MIRIFTAIDLPLDIKNSLNSLRCKIKGARWIGPDQMHLTLSFIGEVPQGKLREITETLDQISYHPFSIKLQGVGHFGLKAFWVGVALNDDLSFLKEEIDQKLKGLGIEIDSRNFRPHITLARLKDAGLANLLEEFSLYESREFEVDKFILYSSNLTQAGAIYSIESEFLF
jgi:2'-5' RNA ligase